MSLHILDCLFCLCSSATNIHLGLKRRGFGDGGGDLSTSSPCLPARSRPATLQDFLASPALEDDNVPRRKETIMAGSKFLCVSALFVCFRKVYCEAPIFCKVWKDAKQTEFSDTRLRQRRRLSSLIRWGRFSPSAAVYSPEQFLLVPHSASFPT